MSFNARPALDFDAVVGKVWGHRFDDEIHERNASIEEELLV
jgi:hypothetical protein